MRKRGKILFGVLNWGLGHAARSIPLIQKLLAEDYEVILASDGEALALLQQEFPQLLFEKLPAYNVHYSKNPYFFSLKLLSQTPYILQTIRKEKKIVRKLADKYQPDFILSDNRFGFRHKLVRSIYITHQLRVLSGCTTPLSTWLHARIYNQYDEIWVPDYAGEINFSGKLGHLNTTDKKIKYIGILHRLQKQETSKQYDIAAVLSGPEPQRSLLEKELLDKMANLPFKTALVQGVVKGKANVVKHKGTDVYNYLTREQLQKLINASETIISRSGYTSIMDLLYLQKKVLWIPTPGQKEQEYLAQYLAEKYGFVQQKQGKICLKILMDNFPATAIQIADDSKPDIVNYLKMNF